MIGTRTQISLAQYLERQSHAFLNLLFEKHGLAESWGRWRDWGGSDTLQALAGFLREVPPDPLQAVEIQAFPIYRRRDGDLPPYLGGARGRFVGG